MLPLPPPGRTLPPAWRPAALAAAIVLLSATPLHPQEQAPPPAVPLAPAAPLQPAPVPAGLLGTVDAGIGVGAARTSRWYGTGGEPGTVSEPGTVGTGPAFSAEVRYWPVPFAGVRLHVGTFAAPIRTQRGEQDLRATPYDVSAVLRPLAGAPVPDALRSLYAFAGGGGIALELIGTPDTLAFDCDGGSISSCMRVVPASGTVDQFTAGAGGDLFTLGGLTVYGEFSLHRYKPRIADPDQTPLYAAANRLSGPAAIIGGPGTVGIPRPAATTTRRLVAGVRRTFGREPPPSPPPPPPPPTTLVGGWLEVRTAQPGAEVYLIPRTVLEDDPGVLCRLRPEMVRGSYFRGRTLQTGFVRTAADPMTMVLVVRQHGRQHQERVQLVRGRTQRRVLDMRVDGTPYRCPP